MLIIVLTQIMWNILGPNTNEVLPSVNTDFGEPVNGSFHFRDGGGGMRSIELQILPHDEVEVAETFIIRLSHLFGDMDIDPRAGSVTLRVRYCYTTDSICVFNNVTLRIKQHLIHLLLIKKYPETKVL